MQAAKVPPSVVRMNRFLVRENFFDPSDVQKIIDLKVHPCAPAINLVLTSDSEYIRIQSHHSSRTLG